MKRKQTDQLPKSFSFLKDAFVRNSDVVINEDLFALSAPGQFASFYCKGMLNKQLLEESILPFLLKCLETGRDINPQLLQERYAVIEHQLDKSSFPKIEASLFSGHYLLLNNQTGKLISINAASIPKRNPEESNTELSIRGARDGFVEDLETNIALIRKRCKSASLYCDYFTVGTRSQTSVCLLYLGDVVNPDLIKRVTKRINQINVDFIISSNQLEEILSDTTYTLFPLLDNSGRPDYAVQTLAQGRFVIVVDGSPSCLIGPASLELIIKSPEDANAHFFMVSFERLLRILSLFVTIFLPGLWVALTNYHQDQIPFPLLATLTLSRSGLPISLPIEMFIMIVLFELFKEAGARLPKAVGQTVAVLGGLIVGDAAIRAGLTSPTTLVVVAITMIASYTFVNQSLSGNVIYLRLLVLILCSMFGLFGFFICIFSVLILVSSLHSFDFPYLSTLSKPNVKDMIKAVIKLPFSLMKERNESMQTQDTTRQKGTQDE